MAKTGCAASGLDWRFLVALTCMILVAFAWNETAFGKDGKDDPAHQLIQAQRLADLPPVAPPQGNRIVDDHSGRKEKGKASIYAHIFDGRTMADGNRYDPRANVAASKSLPLGTIAKVTNLRTGKSTDVKIEDRGPFVDGRVVDLTPHAAHAIGLTMKQGLAPVIVSPIVVPQPNGTLKLGAGAAPTPPAETEEQPVQTEEASNR